MPPLDGVRVADLTRLLPGAYATRLLADLGAEVIKVEDPRGGDPMRQFGAQYFDALNHGKRSVTLDLRSPDAAAILDALLSACDVVVDSFRPSTARRLGVDAGTLRAKRPRLICASMIGFDRDSARAEAAAHDINYQALAGLLARGATSSPGPAGRPLARSWSKGEAVMPGPLVGDVGAAMQTAIRILAALVDRDRTGIGAAIDVSIQSAAEAWSAFPSTADFASACYTLYETADGEWLALGALEPKFWRAFCERLGRPDFVPLQHAAEFDEIRAVMRAKPRDEWLALFKSVDTCLTPVLPPASAAATTVPAPALGADTDAVLAAAGIRDEARARLRASGVI